MLSILYLWNIIVDKHALNKHLDASIMYDGSSGIRRRHNRHLTIAVVYDFPLLQSTLRQIFLDAREETQLQEGGKVGLVRENHRSNSSISSPAPTTTLDLNDTDIKNKQTELGSHIGCDNLWRD
jgi:hypothetical protein